MTKQPYYLSPGLMEQLVQVQWFSSPLRLHRVELYVKDCAPPHRAELDEEDSGSLLVSPQAVVSDEIWDS